MSPFCAAETKASKKRRCSFELTDGPPSAQIRSKRIRYCLHRSPAHNLKSLSQNDGMVGLVSTTGRHELPRLKLNEVLNGAIERADQNNASAVEPWSPGGDDMSVTKMSLDNTTQPGRPGLDELVPSRYAVRIGEIDVRVISDGVLSLPGEMLGHNVDPAVRAAWLEDKFLPPDVLEWALNAVVVRSGDRTILIDAGIGADPGLNLPRAGKFVQRLQAAGIDLASVTDVVLTHMHMDHCGGLLVDDGTVASGPADP